MSRHATTWVKVNVPVDTGIVDLVNSLSAFPQLQTIESCQGNDKQPAWVCFQYGDHWAHPWRALAEFALGCLGPGLADQVGDRAGVAIHVTESGRIQGELTVRPGALELVVETVKRLREDFKD